MKRPFSKILTYLSSCLCLATMAFGGVSAAGTGQTRGEARVHVVEGSRTTPVEGPSWLRHMGIPFAASNMGRVGDWGPPVSARIAGQPSSGPGPEGTFLVSGADLYRLSCESCHKADGGGAPPGINSLIGPVQATSPAMIRQQMKQRGVEVESKMVAELALQAETALRKRLQNGGEKMPPFRDLNGKEVEALIGYLRDLAGVPGADRGQTLLNEPALRVGELLVKGTCHICHDATGRGLRRNIEAAPGEIPSLASLPEARTQLEMIRKVREGFALPDAMVISGRGEMPLFVYITPEEVAAAYMYLLSYPPRSGERRDTTSGGRAP